MKVKDLIDALKNMPPDLEVYGYCDHGQTPEKVCNPSIAYTDVRLYTLDAYGWTIYGDDELYNKPFVIL